MPHDASGLELKVGDIVNVPCRIVKIFPGEVYCNVNVETLHHMYPTDNVSSFTLNARQVEFLEKKDEEV